MDKITTPNLCALVKLIDAINRWRSPMRDDHTLCKAADAAYPALVLLRDAGGARPASDVDALIERELQIADGETMLGWDGDARDRRKVVAALVQLRDSEALARGKIAEQMIEIARLQDDTAEIDRLRGENARLKDALRQANGVRDVFASAVVMQAAQDARESIEEFSHAKTDEILRLSADNELWQDRCLALQTERDALAKDAELLQAMAAEWNQNRRGVRYAGMPIWDALCEAIGNDVDGVGMRAAIDAAKEKP